MPFSRSGFVIDCASLPLVELVSARPFLPTHKATAIQESKSRSFDNLICCGRETASKTIPTTPRSTIHKTAPRNRGSGALKNQKISEDNPMPSMTLIDPIGEVDRRRKALRSRQK